MEIKQAHVVITGASSGIGEALARALARAGARLTLVARRKDRLEALARELGGGAHVVAHDLAAPAKATDWVAGAEDAMGPIDVLINSAGIEASGAFWEADPDEGARVMAMNLETPLRLIRAVLPGMVRRGRGAIVNLSSIVAVMTPPLGAWYVASKAALAAAMDSVRGELHGTGVAVVTVMPGFIATPMVEALHKRIDAQTVGQGKKNPLGAMPVGRPEVLARRIVRAIQRGEQKIIYPWLYRVLSWMPPLARWVTARMMRPLLPTGTRA
jgi:short-subunit dehydrogenase